MCASDSYADISTNCESGAQDVLKRLTHHTQGCVWRPRGKSIPSELPSGEAAVSFSCWAHEK